MKELVQHKYLRKDGDKTFEVQNDLYIKELDSLFQDCNELKKRAKYAILNQKSLTDLFIDFNKCKGCNYTCYIKKSEDKNKVVFGIVAGTSITGNGLSNPNVTFFNPIIGVNLSIYSRRNRGSRSLFLEVFYESETVALQTLRGSFTQNNFYLNATYRRHILLQNKIQPFYGFGLNVKYTTSQSLYDKYGFYLLDSDEINNQILAELGFEYKKIQFNLRAKYQIIENEKLNFQTSVTYQFK